MKKGKLTNSERRRYIRLQPKEAISVRFKVISREEGEKAAGSHRAKTKNVSGGGMFLQTPILKPMILEGVLRGTHNLFLEIDVPTVPYPIKALAKAVWVEGKDGDGYGIGVSFLSINEEDRDKLTNYIIGQGLRE